MEAVTRKWSDRVRGGARRVGIAVVFLAAGAWVAPTWAVGEDLMARAREVAGKAREAMQASSKAAAEGDADAAERLAADYTNYLNEARALFDKASAGDSRDPEVLSEYGRVLNLLGDYDLAAEAYERAVMLDPKNAAHWRALGVTLAELGPRRAAGAALALRHSIEMEPGAAPVQAYLALARLYRREGLCDLARKTYMRVLELSPEDVRAKIGLLGVKVREGQMREAAEDAEKLGQLNPDAQTLLQTTVEESLEGFQESRRCFPDTPEDHMAYARILLLPGGSEWAAQSILPLEHVVKLQPDNYVAFNFLGSVCGHIGHTARAKEAFERSLQINPDQPRTRESLAALSQEKKESAPPESPGHEQPQP